MLAAGTGYTDGFIRRGRYPDGGDLGLGRGCFHLLQAQFRLLDQPEAAFGALAVELMPQLGDLHLLVGNQRPVGGSLRTAGGDFGAQRVNIVGQRFRSCIGIGIGIGIHDAN